VVSTNQPCGTTNISGFFIGRNNNPQGLNMPSKLAFNVNAQTFGVLLIGGYPQFQLYYDATNYTYFSNSVVQMAYGQGYCIATVTFPTKAARNIVALASSEQGGLIAGVYVQSGDSISKSTLPMQALVVCPSASYGEGYTAQIGTPPPVTDYRWLGSHYQWDEALEYGLGNYIGFVPQGEGGTGFLNPGGGGAGGTGESNLQQRVYETVSNAVFSTLPTYIFLGGDLAMNDWYYGFTQTNDYIAATNVFHILTQYVAPSHICIDPMNFFSSPSSFTGPTVTQTNYGYWIGNAAIAVGITNVDRDFINTNVLTTVNYPYFCGSGDGVHPLPWHGDGYFIMATNEVAHLNATFGFGTAVSLNVTNFGAWGDATNCLVNCTSNSAVVTFPVTLPQSYVNEAIILFNAGWAQYGTLSSGSSGVGWQDQVATISSISGTSVTMSRVASNTLTGAYCVVGRNNTVSNMNCYAQCGPGTNMYFPGAPYTPTGVYLSIPIADTSGPYGCWCLALTNGGVVIYGDGTNCMNTNAGPDLMCSGAWQYKNYAVGGGGPVEPSVLRGEYFQEYPPAIQNGSLLTVVSNLTVDGGVQVGLLTGTHGEAINQTDGGQWDDSDHGLEVWDNNGDANFLNLVFINAPFMHWRGEENISIDQPSAGFTTFINGLYVDGNATAANIYTGFLYTNCAFNGLYQWFEEQYQNCGPGTFINCTVTNIGSNLAAYDGGVLSSHPQSVLNCTIWPWGLQAGGNANGIQCQMGDYITISNCAVTYPTGSGNIPFVTATTTGYFGGTGPGTNLVIENCSLTNFSQLFQAGATTGLTALNTVTIQSNYIASVNTDGQPLYLVDDQYFGQTSNYMVIGNSVNPAITQTIQTSSGGGYSGVWTPFAYVAVNNQITNAFTVTSGNVPMYYSNGPNALVTSSISGGSLTLDTTWPNFMPTNGQVSVRNASANSAALTVWLNTAHTAGSYSQPANSVQVYSYSPTSQAFGTNGSSGGGGTGGGLLPILVKWTNVQTNGFTILRTNSSPAAPAPWPIGWEGPMALQGTANFPVVAGGQLFIRAQNSRIKL
jgi:hypothetical protein